VAATLQGLHLPPRRDLKLVPYIAGSVSEDRTLAEDSADSTGDVGGDFKWGVRAGLTLDLTVNTDFAQVEADVQQVNLTRFPLFFPEKRPFFLENAQLFQVGQPQNVDLFFSRRVGLSAAGEPIDIIAGGRLSGKLSGYNVALLNMQTEAAVDERSGETVAPANNFTVARLQREVGRSTFGGIFVGRLGVGDRAADEDYNRAYGLDVGWQATTNGRVTAFVARTDSPAARGGSDYTGRAAYTYANNLWSGGGAYTQVGDAFNPEVGFLRRRGYRSLEGRYSLGYQPLQWPWIRRIQPHVNYTTYLNLDNELESSSGHWHVFDIVTREGARFGYLFETAQDRPDRPFVVYEDGTGYRVVIPAGEYAWTRGVFEGHTNLSLPVNASLLHRIGSYYDGDYHGWQLTIGLRAGARLLTEASWSRDDITLPRELQKRPGAGEGELRVHQPGECAGSHPVQPPDIDHLVQCPPGAAQSQRNRLLHHLQRSPGQVGVHAGRTARPVVRGEVHALVRLLISAPCRHRSDRRADDTAHQISSR